MENLNAEQVKKALECCIVNDWNSTKCNECPIYNGGGGCIDELKEFTLALINSQEQRIKELTEENEDLNEDKLELEAILDLRSKRKYYTKFVKEVFQKEKGNKLSYPDFDYIYELYFKLAEENERLNNQARQDTYIIISLHDKLAEKQADTVRKMQERLKMYFGTYILGYKIPLNEVLKIINQIAEEMLEGEK